MVGKTAWTQSLGTTDKVLARQLRAELVARYSAEIRAIRGALARKPQEDALKLLNRASSRLSQLRASMDAAIAHQLQLLANIVCDA